MAVLRYGDGRRILQLGEAASFTMTWDQVHFEGGRATPGPYVAHVHLAHLVNNWNLSPGPTAYPESTEGGRLVSILKWPEGAPLNLG